MMHREPIYRYLVKQRFDLLLSLPLADFVRISNLEELWRDLHQPLRFNGCNLVAVFSGR